MQSMSSCELSVDVLSCVVRQCGKPDENVVRFTRFNLAELAQLQICSKLMKSAISRVLHLTKTLNIAYVPENTDMVRVNGYLVENSKFLHCVCFLISESSYMSHIVFTPELGNTNHCHMIRLVPYNAFIRRTLSISESWKLTDISSTLRRQKQASSMWSENKIVITKPLIPSILALRIKDPVNFDDGSYHATKAVKQLIKTGCKANCLELTIDSMIEGSLLYELINSLQVIKLKWNWKATFAFRHSQGLSSFLDYAEYQQLKNITSLKMSVFGFGWNSFLKNKVYIESGFPNLELFKVMQNNCDSCDEMILWISEYFGNLVNEPKKVVLLLNYPMNSFHNHQMEFEREARRIFRQIVANVSNIATADLTAKQNAVKISLKATNKKSTAVVFLRAGKQGNSPFMLEAINNDFFPFISNDFVAVNEGDKFPDGAVKAMNRRLNNKNRAISDSYVAHAIINGESTFGRAFNKNGKVSSIFSYDWKTFTGSSNIVSQLKILTLPANRDYDYVWLRESDGDSQNLERIEIYPRAPCVFSNIVGEDGTDGEVLGKMSVLEDQHEGWTAVNDAELRHLGKQLENAYQLFVKPRDEQAAANYEQDVTMQDCEQHVAGASEVEPQDRATTKSRSKKCRNM